MEFATIFSVFLFIASLFFAALLPRKNLKIAVGIIALIYIFALCFDLLLFFVFGKHFGLFVITFFRTSIESAPIASFAREIAILTAICVAIVLLSVIITVRILHFHRSSKLSILFVPCILAAFFLNPLYIAAKEYYLQLYPPVEAIKNRVYPYLAVPHPKAPFKHKNIVYIFLESFNRAYTDDRIFVGLTPRLNALKNRIDFSEIHQVVDTDFTIKGLFGSHCAVNYTFASAKDMASENFTKNIVCASEILHSLGYYTYFIKGADLDFQGTRGFLLQRGYDEMNGRDEILAADPSIHTNEWGVDDDDMLRIAWNDFERLSKAGKPFLLSLLTIGTHAPNGFIPHACEGLKYDENAAPMLCAVHCSDLLVSKFIEQIRSSPYGANTIIILQNDHPLFYKNAIDSGFGDGLKDERDLFVILDDDLGGEFEIKKRGTSFDTFTTVLGYLGILDEMNFGRNLLTRESLPFDADDEFFINASRIFPELSYDEAVRAQQESSK